jgi:mono/diheme cytochrome c family protein
VRALARSWWALAALAMPVATVAQDTSVAAVGASGNGPRFAVELIEQGRVQFHRTCAQCHGRNMVNAGTTVFDLRKFPLNESDRFQNSVTHGKGNMPSFKDALPPEQIGLLWAYVGSRGGKEN